MIIIVLVIKLEIIVEYAAEQPAHCQARTGNELLKKVMFVSPSGVGSA